MNRDRPLKWRTAPATAGQLALLARYGIDAPIDATQGEVSDMLDWCGELGSTYGGHSSYDDDYDDDGDDIDFYDQEGLDAEVNANADNAAPSPAASAGVETVTGDAGSPASVAGELPLSHNDEEAP